MISCATGIVYGAGSCDCVRGEFLPNVLSHKTRLLAVEGDGGAQLAHTCSLA
jgi:hypothetical protein